LVGEAAITITILLAYPLNVFPMRYTVEHILDGEPDAETAVSPRIAAESWEALPQEAAPVAIDMAVHGDGSTEADPGFGEEEVEFKCWRHCAITAAFVASATSVAMFLPNIQVVFSLLGSTTSAFVCYIVPGMYTLEMYKRDDVTIKATVDKALTSLEEAVELSRELCAKLRKPLRPSADGEVAEVEKVLKLCSGMVAMVKSGACVIAGSELQQAIEEVRGALPRLRGAKELRDTIRLACCGLEEAGEMVDPHYSCHKTAAFIMVWGGVITGVVCTGVIIYSQIAKAS